MTNGRHEEFETELILGNNSYLLFGQHRWIKGGSFNGDFRYRTHIAKTSRQRWKKLTRLSISYRLWATRFRRWAVCAKTIPRNPPQSPRNPRRQRVRPDVGHRNLLRIWPRS